jgi:hypothetical protein
MHKCNQTINGQNIFPWPFHLTSIVKQSFDDLS